MRTICRNFRILWCVLNGGHETVLRARPGKLALQCPCGYVSPGWDVGTAEPKCAAASQSS